MQRRFERKIDECKSRLVDMGTIVERMIDASVKSLVDRKAEGHAMVFKDEESVNELQIEVDERAIAVLALQHPVASDLRLVVMCSKIAGELERIGDQAVNICQNTAAILKYPSLKPVVDIPLMADVARGMVREGLDAFIRRDADLAQKILETDDKVDAFKDRIFREFLASMMAEPDTIPRALPLILISRNLERVGDHATNIAEEVIYAVQGREVRHNHEKRRRGEGP